MDIRGGSVLVDQLVVLYDEGSELAFLPETGWRTELADEEICCSHCEAVRPEMRSYWTSVKLHSVPPGLSIGPFQLGALIIRKDLAAVIGREMLERRCRALPISDGRGAAISDFECWVEREQRGKIRGSVNSSVGLCQECGRFLYWPVGNKYLLRKYWDPVRVVDFFDNKILCNRREFSRIRNESGISSLVAEPIDVLDVPADGFPMDYQEMVQAAKDRGLTK